MTPGTKCDPLIARALAAPKLNRVRYAHFLFMKLPETLQLLLCLLMIKAITFKSRFKYPILRLKNAILTFRLRKLIKRQRKALAEHVGHRDFLQGISGNIENAHMSPNY